ncbi:MAG TPA: SDR family oxidoreductase [Acidimicrobiia bacterium]|nr:SDR family oxidoreductase [Acidimicrobiia bacterium]
MDPDGRCVVVTGGGHGIGRALAERFARDGARVVVADVHEARAAKIAERIDGLAVACDVASRDAVEDLVARAVDAFGPVYAFCSNAGIGGGGGLDASTGDVERVVGVNLLAHVWAAQAVVPMMVEQGEGYLVQTLSSAALITGPSPMGYTLTKHGALGLAEWIALNYAHLGVRVACLCPNAVNTGFFGRDEDAEEAAGAVAADRAAALELGDVVEPELCADMAIDALREGRFLVLPHPRVGESFQRKAGDYDRWLEGTNRRLRRMAGEDV